MRILIWTTFFQDKFCRTEKVDKKISTGDHMI